MNQLPERLTLQQFHGDEVLAVGFVDFENGADIRMIQRGGGKGFALKTLARRGIILQFGR